MKLSFTPGAPDGVQDKVNHDYRPFLLSSQQDPHHDSGSDVCEWNPYYGWSADQLMTSGQLNPG